jgi:hypothetical protein
MNEKLDKVVPRETLQGDTKPMPDRGTSTGLTDTYGAQTNLNATNRIGGMGNGAKSDGAGQA